MKTGTKKSLHLRAESREDKETWIEALKAVKGLFPRSPNNADTMASPETVLLSTQKLRERLLQEGVGDTVIQDCETIMKNELLEMHKHIVALKLKQMLLLDSVRQLEASLIKLRFRKP